MDEERLRSVLGEQILGELKAIHELVMDVPKIKATVDEHSLILEDHGSRLIVIEDIVRKNTLDIRELKADVTVLKADVSELKTDVKELKADASELKQIAGNHSQEISGLETAKHSH